MPAYIVQIDPTAAPLVEGNLNAAVFAEDAAAARLAASSLFNNDQNTVGGGGSTVSPYYTALWAAATVTEIVAGDLEGAILRVQVIGADPVIDYSVTGAAAATVDDIGALMVTALNGDAQIAGAAYSAGNLLTVSDIADALGDLTLQVDFTLNGESLGAFVGAITDGGIAAAVLTVQMAADVIAIPTAVASW
jgi:hypothetical protein